MKPYKWKRDASIGVSGGNKSAAMSMESNAEGPFLRRRLCMPVSVAKLGGHLDVELTKEKVLTFNFP